MGRTVLDDTSKTKQIPLIQILHLSFIFQCLTSNISNIHVYAGAINKLLYGFASIELFQRGTCTLYTKKYHMTTRQ